VEVQTEGGSLGRRMGKKGDSGKVWRFGFCGLGI